jgi:16S rRNA (cytidine1402-2'-O)-methyltransferase
MTPSELPLAASYLNALRAAKEAAGQQNYEPGTLYVVATPIGNLADISLRALHLLQMVDALACEDTRHTQSLLRAYGIDRPTTQLLAVHQHNEVQATQSVIERLRAGARIAYVSDAGTPAVSDPGARLVAATRLAGLRVVPVPGASSVTALLSAAGIAPDAHQTTGFVFEGFLSSKATERITAVAALSKECRAVVLLEAPHRIEALALALATLGSRMVTIGRELTKQFEEIATLNAQALPGWLAQDANRLRGEFTLILHPLSGTTSAEPDTRVLQLLLTELPLKTAVKLAAEITGESRNTLYELALRLKSQSSPPTH